jgi:hypothetical protein
MKATSYEPEEYEVKDDLCDTPTSVTGVTDPSIRTKKLPMLISRYIERCDNQTGGKVVTSVTGDSSTMTIDPTSVTRHKGGVVTACLVVPEFYWQRLKMSKRKIRSVWLTIERAAELLGCSTRTVWRYIKRNKIEVHKHLIVLDGYKVVKTFLLTEPSLYIKEMADCQARQIAPVEFIELTLAVDGRELHSALIYKYASGGGQHEYL